MPRNIRKRRESSSSSSGEEEAAASATKDDEKQVDIKQALTKKQLYINYKFMFFRFLLQREDRRVEISAKTA